ncbi:MAG: NAD(P)-dependent oxidoreductase [Lautropia sp.]
MPRVLLTHSPDALANYYGDEALAGLCALAEVRLNPLGRDMDVDEMIDAARDCELIVSYRKSEAPARVFSSLPSLVAFSRCAIDIRNIDVDAASANGVLVTQAGPGFVASVAEWTIGAMVDLSRGLGRASAEYHAGRVPAATMGRELYGATLGVIGYGRIARYLCRVALAFGMRVVVADPYARVPGTRIRRLGLDEVLAEADYLVCLAVATEETENLMDAAAFARMKPGAYFVNPSRGNLVDEAALCAALDSGRLAGCALDVGRAPDQMPTPALAAHPRVIATPHVGGLTPPAINRQAMDTVAQVAAILKGDVPKGAVNAARASRFAAMRARAASDA